jgi:hypothetical protein
VTFEVLSGLVDRLEDLLAQQGVHDEWLVSAFHSNRSYE